MVTRQHAYIAALVLGLGALGTMVVTQAWAGSMVILGPFIGLIGSENNDGSWGVVEFVLIKIGPYLAVGLISQLVIKPTEIGNVWRYMIWGITCLIWLFGSFVAIFAQLG